MIDFSAIPPALITFAIFLLRVGDMSLDTLRILYVIRSRRGAAWILGFLQSSIWVIAITSVLSNLDNLWNIVAYGAGFATGNVIGMALEEFLAIGHAHLRIISSRMGSAIVEALRGAGYAATEVAGRGKDGTVAIISSSVRRRDIAKVQKEISQIDAHAFVSVEEVRPLNRGFWRA